MKNLSILTLFLLLYTHALWAQTEKVVTFLPSTDHVDTESRGEHSLSKEGVTITTSDGIMGYDSEYRFYTQSTLTLSTISGKLTKIILNGTKSQPPSNFTKASTGTLKASSDKTKLTWTGEAQTLTLTNTSTVVWVTSIEVTVINGTDESGKAVPELVFSSPSVTATIGEPFTSPTLSKPDEVTQVEYQSSDISLATVDKVSGAVTIGERSGTVTITATTQETEHYQAASASYTIIIKNAYVAAYGNYPDSYLLVTDEETLRDGDQVIFVHMSTPSGQAMTAKQTDRYRDDTVLAGFNADGSVIHKNDYALFTVEKSGDYWCFHDALGYLYASSNTQNALGTRSDITADAQALVTITNNVARIQFQGNNSYRFLRFSNSLEGFVCTASSTNNEPVRIYRKAELPTEMFQISDANYATIYADHEVLVPNGVVAHTIADANGTLYYGTNYNAGEIIPKQTPVVLEGHEGSYAYFITNTGAAAPTHNMLRGSTGTRDDEPGYRFYKLAWRSDDDHTAGFYYDTPDGKSIQIAAGKAYLAVPEDEAQAKGYAFNEDITGIRRLTAESSPHPVYSLSGQRLSDNAQQLPKGIYIQNGKKIIIR